jgi:hypothetical protein
MTLFPRARERGRRDRTRFAPQIIEPARRLCAHVSVALGSSSALKVTGVNVDGRFQVAVGQVDVSSVFQPISGLGRVSGDGLRTQLVGSSPARPCGRSASGCETAPPNRRTPLGGPLAKTRAQTLPWRPSPRASLSPTPEGAGCSQPSQCMLDTPRSTRGTLRSSGKGTEAAKAASTGTSPANFTPVVSVSPIVSPTPPTATGRDDVARALPQPGRAARAERSAPSPR